VIRRSVAAMVLLGSLAGCTGFTGGTGTGTGAATTASVELTIYAAASLRDALEQAAAAFHAANPAVSLTIATDSSTALAIQIEQGAPADVFLSADTTNPARLAAAGLTDGGPVPFAANELAIAVAPGNPAGIASPFDLARSGVRVIAAADEVPIAAYAAVLVANLAAEPGAPAGFAAGYAANVRSRELNVRAVVAKIQLGEGDAGIVYATDVVSDGVGSIPIVPATANVRATYAGVVIGASGHPALAHDFLAWLAGPPGVAVLGTAGFLPPP
jgi:molybdate transport system substrate-binding protein